MTGEFGIVANVVEVDRVLRLGAKVTVVGFMNGMCERIQVRGLSRGGRPVTKFTSFKKLSDFRAKWLTDEQRKDACFLGERAVMEERARSLQDLADRERAAHPHRQFQAPRP